MDIPWSLLCNHLLTHSTTEVTRVVLLRSQIVNSATLLRIGRSVDNLSSWHIHAIPRPENNQRIMKLLTASNRLEKCIAIPNAIQGRRMKRNKADNRRYEWPRHAIFPKQQRSWVLWQVVKSPKSDRNLVKLLQNRPNMSLSYSRIDQKCRKTTRTNRHHAMPHKNKSKCR